MNAFDDEYRARERAAAFVAEAERDRRLAALLPSRPLARRLRERLLASLVPLHEELHLIEASRQRRPARS